MKGFLKSSFWNALTLIVHLKCGTTVSQPRKTTDCLYPAWSLDKSIYLLRIKHAKTSLSKVFLQINTQDLLFSLKNGGAMSKYLLFCIDII